MALTETPVCDFGKKPNNFNLISTKKINVSLDDIRGKNGTLIMFICNHCPYVKAIIKDLTKEVSNLERIGIKSVAIMSNDTKNYPEDSFIHMIDFAKKYNFSFPYLFDDTQETARLFDAVCTPDFFGYNKDLELQYRGRFKELKNLKTINSDESDLFKAMKLIASSNKGPQNQIPSMGCSIKWFK